MFARFANLARRVRKDLPIKPFIMGTNLRELRIVQNDAISMQETAESRGVAS
jgi:hypothetical protein